MQGRDLTNNLAGVLIRFREEGVAFTADIEAMFHQTRVTPKDTYAIRFLWWSSSIEEPPEEYQMLAGHIFGANKALRKAADDNEQNYGSKAIKTVHRNLYVDDCLKSVHTTEQAIIHLVDQLMKLLKEGGLRLTKCSCTFGEVLPSIPAEERANPIVSTWILISYQLSVDWDCTGMPRLTLPVQGCANQQTIHKTRNLGISSAPCTPHPDS